MIFRVLFCLFFINSNFGFSQEVWSGLEGGGLKHNVSNININPANLEVLWQRTFYPVPEGDQHGDQDEMHLASGHGSRNLAHFDGMLAILAADRPGLSNGVNDYYLSILSAKNGETLNLLRAKSSKGNSRVYRWPHYGVSMSSENITGFVQFQWDPETRIIYLGQGSYNSSYTAWSPMSNIHSFDGNLQEAVPAFAGLDSEFPGNEDSFGRTRRELFTVFGPDSLITPMQPYTWGLSGFYRGEDLELPNGNKNRYDQDLEKIYGRQGSSYYNTSSYFNLDTSGDLIIQTKGAEWGHNTGGDLYIFNKHTGMKAFSNIGFLHDERLRPFTMEGAIVGNGMIFCAGASEGKLGIGRPEGNVPKRDQGLALWAYNYTMSDQKPNGNFVGKGKLETAILEPVFEYRLKSRFIPDSTDIHSYGQSYYECDGFYRNKAMLIDNDGVWYAWKPGADEYIELVYADKSNLKKYALHIGHGLYGVDIWPKMSLSSISGHKYISMFTGYARHRKRFIPEDPLAALKDIHGDDFKNLWDKDIEMTIEQAPQAGIWSKELFDPRGPAELAVFDVKNESVKWTFNVSEMFPTIPANDFWTYLDQTAMVVAGKYIYLGWIDSTQNQAELLLLCFDLTQNKPTPKIVRFPLGFESYANGKSALFDLIAVDGKLYALVTKSNKLSVRDPRWENQIILALGPQKENEE